jgi:sec-independent protein translocase protein TatB
MFDIGFWELTLIAVVALLVIGPERLPKVARTVGLWTGRMRGFVMSVKADIDREMRAEELKRIMDEQARSTGIHEILEETRTTLDDLEKPDYLVKAIPPVDDTSHSTSTEQVSDTADIKKNDG